jgi:hypothetical protein
MIQKEKGSCGDIAVATYQANAITNEEMGVHGFYQVVCRDAQGNIKWEEEFPNLVVAVGKQLMLDTLLKGVTYSVTGPYLGLISGSTNTFAATDTMTSHPGWTEFINYTVGGSAVRGTAVFGSSTSTGTSPSNITTSLASSITFTITGAGGVVGGCFLVLGSGATNAQSSTAGTLYSAGEFSTPKTTTSGDTVSVTYATTATS